MSIKDKIENCLPSFSTMEEVVKYIITLVFFIVVGYLLYYYFSGPNYSHTINCRDCLLFFSGENNKITSKSSISNDKFVNPINGSFYSFVLEINEFYSSAQNWRHIFFIVSKPSASIPDEKFNYNNMNVQGVNEQTPGIWLEPKKNNIRIVLSVVNKIEYFDVNNISIGIPITFSVNINGNTCEIYLNGKLYQTYEAKNTINYSSGDCYFLQSNRLSWGSIKNFRYIPNYQHPPVIQYINNVDNNESNFQNNVLDNNIVNQLVNI